MGHGVDVAFAGPLVRPVEPNAVGGHVQLPHVGEARAGRIPPAPAIPVGHGPVDPQRACIARVVAPVEFRAQLEAVGVPLVARAHRAASLLAKQTAEAAAPGRKPVARGGLLHGPPLPDVKRAQGGLHQVVAQSDHRGQERVVRAVGGAGGALAAGGGTQVPVLALAENIAGPQIIHVRPGVDRRGERESVLGGLGRGVRPVYRLHDQDAVAHGLGAKPSHIVDGELGGARDRAPVHDDLVAWRVVAAKIGVERNGAALAGQVGHGQGLGREGVGRRLRHDAAGQGQVAEHRIAGHDPFAGGVDGQVHRVDHAGQVGVVGQMHLAMARVVDDDVARERRTAGREREVAAACAGDQAPAVGTDRCRHVVERHSVGGARGSAHGDQGSGLSAQA